MVDFGTLLDLQEEWEDERGKALFEELAVTHPLASIWWGAGKSVDEYQLRDALDAAADDFSEWLADRGFAGRGLDDYVDEFRYSVESALTGK